MKSALFKNLAPFLTTLLVFGLSLTVFAQKQVADTDVESQPGLVQFKMSQVVGYGLQGEWELQENGSDTIFYPIGNKAHHVLVYTSKNSGTHAIKIKNSEALIESDLQLQVYGDPTLSPEAMIDLIALDADADGDADITIYSYNETHVVAQASSGDCWGVGANADTAACNQLGEKGCTWSVELSTGRCYRHHVPCPENEGETTGSVQRIMLNGATYIKTDMPRTRIDCDDM